MAKTSHFSANFWIGAVSQNSFRFSLIQLLSHRKSKKYKEFGYNFFFCIQWCFSQCVQFTLLGDQNDTTFKKKIIFYNPTAQICLSQAYLQGRYTCVLFTMLGFMDHHAWWCCCTWTSTCSIVTQMEIHEYFWMFLESVPNNSSICISAYFPLNC